MHDRKGFHQGFFQKMAKLGYSKEDAGRVFLKMAANPPGSENAMKSMITALPYVLLATGALGGGATWLLQQGVRADEARREKYVDRLDELDRTVEDLEESGVISPDTRPPTMMDKIKGVFS